MTDKEVDFSFCFLPKTACLERKEFLSIPNTGPASAAAKSISPVARRRFSAPVATP
jgi:hypothetical protein